MDGADYGKAMAELWGSGSRTLLAAQQGVLRAMREGAADPAGAAVPGAEAAKAMQALTEMWSSALGVSSALAGTLPAGGAEEEGTPAATLRRMADPRAWLSAGDGVDEALQRLAEGPRLADAGEVERRLAKVSRAWLALRQRSAEHQAVVLEGWMRAGRDFARKLAEQGKDDAFATSPRRMLDLWVETANRALLDTQRSEPFLRGQAALLKASTDLRFAQRDIAEHYADSFGLPTRRELDDVHRSVTELRRELRALTRRARAEDESRTARPEPELPSAAPRPPRPAKRPAAPAPVTPSADGKRPARARAAARTEARENNAGTAAGPSASEGAGGRRTAGRRRAKGH